MFYTLLRCMFEYYITVSCVHKPPTIRRPRRNVRAALADNPSGLRHINTNCVCAPCRKDADNDDAALQTNIGAPHIVGMSQVQGFPVSTLSFSLWLGTQHDDDLYRRSCFLSGPEIEPENT